MLRPRTITAACIYIFGRSRMSVYSSVFQPGFRGNQRFRQFLAGFLENVVLYGAFRFRQIMRKFLEVPRLEKG